WYGTVTIDKGSAAGVREGMVVVEAQGLVGRVVSTSPHTAVVRLLTDPQSGVGAQVQRAESGAYGVVLGQGSGRQLNMRFYSRDADVVPGDVVVTSGLSALFPAGLPIGRVTAVDSEDFGLVRTARVEPFADIDRLREVLLLPFPPPVGAAPGGERA
ncbi:MAG: rod shape-determining protein MreC, partial [Clostridia bacterium]|nr:rod shape-determining protein MreC [Clostridia bacterium]